MELVDTALIIASSRSSSELDGTMPKKHKIEELEEERERNEWDQKKIRLKTQKREEREWKEMCDRQNFLRNRKTPSDGYSSASLVCKPVVRPQR